MGGCNFKEIKMSNKTIRNIFNNISYLTLSYRNSISQFFPKPIIQTLRTRYLKFPIAPKLKEIHFKILNSVYPSSSGSESKPVTVFSVTILKQQTIYSFMALILKPYGWTFITGFNQRFITWGIFPRRTLFLDLS